MAESIQAGGDTGKLEVRPARAQDRAAVLAFCERTWEDGDYIADVWDNWLGDEQGALLVGLIGGEPVAIVHMRMMSDDEAWLEGIRVAPEVRGQGIGRVMLSRALVAARERGGAVARLFTEHDNLASQRLVAKFGFTRVAEVVVYVGDALAGQDAPETTTEATAGNVAGTTAGVEDTGGPRLRTPGPEAFDDIWAWLEQSNLSPFNGGLEFEGWSARALTEPLLRGYLAAGEVWLLEEHGALLALAVTRDTPTTEREPAWLQVRYIDGLAESIGRLALTLRAVAGERGLAEADLWLPDLLILQDAMNGADFRREIDGAMWVYARELA